MSLPDRSNIRPAPNGQEVEKLAITLAAAVGAVWASIPEEAAAQYRVMANAALMRYRDGIPATPQAAAALDEAVQAIRSGARGLEGIDEGLIQRLYKAAARLEILANVVATEVDLGADEELV